MEEFRKENERFKARQKWNFDKQHRTKDSDTIPSDTTVWITSEGEKAPATVVSSANSPRSYLVETPSGMVRRNRIHLNVDPSPPSDQSKAQIEPEPDSDTRRIITRSQTGTVVKPPERLYA